MQFNVMPLNGTVAYFDQPVLYYVDGSGSHARTTGEEQYSRNDSPIHANDLPSPRVSVMASWPPSIIHPTHHRIADGTKWSHTRQRKF
jgi:hypothetical protein